MKFTIRQLWVKACEFDSINPNDKFVIFSGKNPWAKKYNTAIGLMLKSFNASR